jgi:iron complex transport system substrate-binding protein
MVATLGAADRLVGRSHACDHPWEVRALPPVTRSRIPEGLPSAEISAEVSRATARQESVFELDVERLRDLKPDLILTQDQCNVCAISSADLEVAMRDWTGPRPEIVRLHPTRLVHLWQDLQRLAELLGLPDGGRPFIAPLKARVVAVLEKTAMLQRRPSVACLEWLDPLMGAGNWIPELVQLAGGHPVFGEAGKHSEWLTWENLALQDPAVLVLTPCGFDLERTRKEAVRIQSHELWPQLRAVKTGRVHLADASAYFNRPGPRLVESLEALAEMIQPEIFPAARHRGEVWEFLR